MVTFNSIATSFKTRVKNLYANVPNLLKPPVGKAANWIKRKAMSISIKQSALYRSRQDIQTWLNALAAVERPDNQRWYELMELYEGITLDVHLTAVMNTRKQRILREYFTLTNTKDEHLTASINQKWFFDFIGHAMDSIHWGFSVVEIIPDKNGKPQCKIIPRRHLAPLEHGIKINYHFDTPFIYEGTDVERQLIEIGEPTDLGLLSRAAPLVLYKKNALSSWSEFAELFGMPIRIGKVNRGDEKAMADMETFLKNMGSSAYAVIDMEDEIEMKETGRADAFNVYDKLIERINADLSKLILGQTMTTENGSSRSQAEVHERIANDYLAADKRMIEHLVNQKLIPLLIDIFGMTELQNATFQFDERIELTELELKIDQFLIQNFEFENMDYFEDKYGVKLKPKTVSKTETNNLSAGSFQKLSALTHEIENLYHHQH